MAVSSESRTDSRWYFGFSVITATPCAERVVFGASSAVWKIRQRGFDAYGPILQGLNAPINDLSRGCNAQEVYSMAIITAGLVD